MAEKDSVSKIKELQGALSNAHDDKLQFASGKVDMVEHQALRQEVENQRKTIKELHQELDEANRQGRQIEDEIEDKNTQIEQNNAEVERLKEALQSSEARRQKSDEARLQAESRAAVMLDKSEFEARDEGSRDSGPTLPYLLKGAALGAGACVILLELFSFASGGGELISNLASGQAAPVAYQPALSVDDEVAATEEKGAGEQTDTLAEEAAPAAVAVSGPVSGERSDGNRIVEDAEAGYSLIALEGGAFMMGNRTGVIVEESPRREVTLKPYLIGRTEVSFDLYDRFARATGRELPNDNGWGRGSLPVINVSWEDAKALSDWLSQRTGKNYRLPTEAEWEYAAGGARESPFWWGYQPGENNANCFNCGSQYDRRSPAPVETFKVNPFGLHSTAGNVQEWVQDCYRKGYADAPTDGSAVELEGCAQRTARGGSYNKPADNMKVTRRNSYPVKNQVPHLGFRLARDAD